MDLSSKIRAIKDYPKEGIIFRDITTLLKDAEGMCEALDIIKKILKALILIMLWALKAEALYSVCL